LGFLLRELRDADRGALKTSNNQQYEIHYMANSFENNNEPPASFKAFLAKHKGWGVTESDAEAFAAFRENYDRVRKEQLKFVSPMADLHIREVTTRAETDPSSENVAALANLNPAEVRSRYENTCSSLHRALENICADAAPLTKRILNAAIKVVESEMQQIEADNRALFERYGVRHEPSRDVLLLSLDRWRKQTEARVSKTQPNRPDEVCNCVGEVRAKSGLLEFLG
jgi:hypothetical protein